MSVQGQALSTNTFGVATFVVSPDPTQGTHTTLGGAIAAATSGSTIWVRAGTYSETVTVTQSQLVIAAAMGEADGNPANVIISGKITYSVSGTLVLANLNLQTSGSAVIAVTGTSASNVHMTHCNISVASSSSGINYTSTSTGSSVSMELCEGDISNASGFLFNMTSPGSLTIYDSNFTNSGASSTASTASAGSLAIAKTIIMSPITTSGTNGLDFNFTDHDTSAQNVIALTVGGSGTNSVTAGDFESGTASAISISSTLQLGRASVTSSNANVITGAGTLNYGPISFLGSSSTINVTTENPKTFGPFIFSSGISFDSGSNTMKVYQEAVSFTPTISGSSVAGTGTYSLQFGTYSRVGNIIYFDVAITWSAHTGTGNFLLSGLPFPVRNTLNYAPVWATLAASIAWGGGHTMVATTGVAGTSTGQLLTVGTGVATANVAMANSGNLQVTGFYVV